MIDRKFCSTHKAHVPLDRGLFVRSSNGQMRFICLSCKAKREVSKP